MFSIRSESGDRIRLCGRLDASQADKAREVLDGVTGSCTLDLSELEYISSAGLRVLLETQRRLKDSGHELKLARLQERIRDLFRVAGFDYVFDIIE